MPMYDLNSDERDTDRIEFTAGGRTGLRIYVDGEGEVFRGEIPKACDVSISFWDEGETDE